MTIDNNSVKIHPFLKWAGGKRWLVGKHPDAFPTKFNRYIEPFVGSGAVYFFLQPSTATLTDLNSDLIETYQAIRNDPDRFLRQLKVHQRNHAPDYYYQVRSSNPRVEHTKAAKFVYLNRTCWNGLYRVNLDGKFNVPIGTKQNVLLPTDDFQKVSELLKSVELIAQDFELTIDSAESEDLLFVDPPYTVKHNYNGFRKYNEKLFTWDDQVRLAESLMRARTRGVHIVATNAAHSSISNLYKSLGFQFEKIRRANVLAASSAARGTYGEYLIRSLT